MALSFPALVAPTLGDITVKPYCDAHALPSPATVTLDEITLTVETSQIYETTMACRNEQLNTASDALESISCGSATVVQDAITVTEIAPDVKFTGTCQESFDAGTSDCSGVILEHEPTSSSSTGGPATSQPAISDGSSNERHGTILCLSALLFLAAFVPHAML